MNKENLLARNKKTPLSLLISLANNEDAFVREGVATNKSTPLGMLKSLSKDKDYCVRREANKNLKEQKANNKISEER